MKKRRNLIISLLLIAAMVVGIGYANLARELSVSSSAQIAVNQNNFAVFFKNGSGEYGIDTAHTLLKDESVTGDAIATTTVDASRTSATYRILGLTNKGDYVTLRYLVTNETTDINAQLTRISSTAGQLYIGEGTANPGDVDEYFTKEISIKKVDSTVYNYVAETDKTYDDIENGTVVLEPGESIELRIKVTLNKTVGKELESMITLSGATVYLNFHPYVATP